MTLINVNSLSKGCNDIQSSNSFILYMLFHTNNILFAVYFSFAFLMQSVTFTFLLHVCLR